MNSGYGMDRYGSGRGYNNNQYDGYSSGRYPNERRNFSSDRRGYGGRSIRDLERRLDHAEARSGYGRRRNSNYDNVGYGGSYRRNDGYGMGYSNRYSNNNGYGMGYSDRYSNGSGMGYSNYGMGDRSRYNNVYGSGSYSNSYEGNRYGSSRRNYY